MWACVTDYAHSRTESLSRWAGGEGWRSRYYTVSNWRWSWWNRSEPSWVALQTEISKTKLIQNQGREEILKCWKSFLTLSLGCNSELREDLPTASSEVVEVEVKASLGGLSCGSACGSPPALRQCSNRCDSKLLSPCILYVCLLTHQLSNWQGPTTLSDTSASTCLYTRTAFLMACNCGSHTQSKIKREFIIF